VFYVDDYTSSSSVVRVAVKFVVRDGTLVAQYAPTLPNSYNLWKKIYRYEAATQTVREIPFGYPPDLDTLASLREEPVAGLQDVRLDTRLQAPDGYELATNEYQGDGLVGGLFWRSGSASPRLRNGASSVPLEVLGGAQNYGSSLQFIGWVVP
jgi:hypothetical protein